MTSPYSAHQERLMRIAAMLMHTKAAAAQQRNEDLESFDILFPQVMQGVSSLYAEMDQQRILDETKVNFKLAEMLLTGFLGVTQRPKT